jgi:uncharacterized phage protein (TIGR02218 family)
MAFHAGLEAHLASGATTVCHAWAITRGDGLVLGFTDHDRELEFENVQFRADSGLSALALQQGTGLSVDNSEAIGALTDAAIREADIDAGRYDGAGVRCWIVNWREVAQRHILFAGTIGEIRRAGGAFTAELRGLAEVLNRPMGRVYQKPCGAVLGDAECRVDLTALGYGAEVAVISVTDARVVLPALPDFEPGWFTRGRLSVLTGAASGLGATIKRDRAEAGGRVLDLWSEIRAEVAPGDLIRVEAGCDKRMNTCRYKFNNLLNYRGFPDIPGEDWLRALPSVSGVTTSESRR